MTEFTGPGFEPVLAVARQAGDIAELLDVMWEHDRNDGPPPYVSVAQFRVMYIVDREVEIRMRALNRILGGSLSSLSRLLDRLQTLGFVERRPCPDSRRETVICLTASGRRHVAQVRDRRDHLLLQALQDMPGHQRAALSKSLARLQQALVDQPALRLAAEEVLPVPTSRDAARLSNIAVHQPEQPGPSQDPHWR
ncbi:MarR family transcriptional regulator [Streptomyces sp. NPDC005385]|uniref:MarR family winged helix-turn-helix transcriptional regulator n=1 Tax=Streptomyces sp. NPDC005385 TaxID=3157039 RepID=UPI0033B9105A